MDLEIEKNVFLREIWQSGQIDGLIAGVAKGLVEGRIEGRIEGFTALLRSQLQTKFGKLPKWADARLKTATTQQAYTWAKKVLSAKSLEAIIGKK